MFFSVLFVCFVFSLSKKKVTVAETSPWHHPTRSLSASLSAHRGQVHPHTPRVGCSAVLSFCPGHQRLQEILCCSGAAPNQDPHSPWGSCWPVGGTMPASSCILPGGLGGMEAWSPVALGGTSALVSPFSFSPIPRSGLPSDWENHPVLPSDGELIKEHLARTEGKPGVFKPRVMDKDRQHP